jgi:hypothetical protein
MVEWLQSMADARDELAGKVAQGARPRVRLTISQLWRKHSRGRPPGLRGRPGWPRRTFQVQNNRKPWRCQPMTVSGLTMSNEDRQSLEASHSQAKESIG